MAYIATATLKSLSPYSQSRRVGPRLPKEDWDAYEERIWKDRCHVNGDGHLFIPPMAFKRSLERAAKYLRMRIPGKDRSEFGKHFLSGVLVVEGLVLPETRDTVQSEQLPLSGSGKPGGMDVLKTMPLISQWSGVVTYYVLDEVISEEVFLRHLTEAGSFIGIGRFRPANGGYYGRYEVAKLVWKQSV